MEQWVKIKNLPNGYFISSWGQIKIVTDNNDSITLGWINANGYRVFKHGKILFYVHLLVLENFEDRPWWAECGNHLNGIKSDNRLSNLEWSTHKLNRNHAIKTGLAKNIKWRKIKKCPVTPTT